VTPAIEDLIVTGASTAQIKEKAIEEGFITMREYGWQKVLSGDTTVEEVLAATTVELNVGGKKHVLST
jgi:type II secretory ATPase GspE/PulE/Tfp pilus assembly ATPase PilB-like protein